MGRFIRGERSTNDLLISHWANRSAKATAKHKMGNLFNPLSANPTKWSNTLKQLVGNLPTNCLGVFKHFVGLTLTGLRLCSTSMMEYFLKIVKGV